MNPQLCPTCQSTIPAHAPGGFCPACLLRDAEERPPSGRAAPTLTEVAVAFPQLEVLALIGQGGMGFVYQARQPSLDRLVALKLLAPELGRDPAFAERFAREARVLGKLSHPNIVAVYEHGESGGYFYLLMEYVDGVNLRQAMRAGRFTPQQALGIVPGICDALQAAHAKGVWHRDIKPENILLDQVGQVKIADFGIARIIGDPVRDFTLTSTGAALGSAAYMAPEQHEKPHDVDHRADIYSLGVVIYEMLTGELPLGRFPAPSQRSAVSARIDEIVFQTLEKERELRQQSAAEVKTDVTRAAHAEAQPPAPTRNDHPAPLTMGSLGLLLAGIMLAVASTVAPALFTVAILFAICGFVAACIALAQMRHGQISKAWRKGLRSFVWLPLWGLIGALILGLVSIPIWMFRSKAAIQNAKAAVQAAQQAAAVSSDEVTVEQLFRKLHHSANESNGEEFRKLVAYNPYDAATNPPITKRMEPFYGKLLLVKLAPPKPEEDQSYLKIFASFERPSGKTEHRMFVFQQYDHHWWLKSDEEPEYRAFARVEFRSAKGEAMTILRTHLNKPSSLSPVTDQPHQYEFSRIARDAQKASDKLSELLESLQTSLQKAGLEHDFKVITALRSSNKPLLLEDAADFQPGIETWSYRLEKLTSLQAIEWCGSSQAEQAGWDAYCSISSSVDRWVLLTGPQEKIRRLVTLLRSLDLSGSQRIQRSPGHSLDTTFVMQMLPALMGKNEFQPDLFTPELLASLQAASITAPQLARSLAAHVLMLDGVAYRVTYPAMEVPEGSGGEAAAGTRVEALIPLQDQPGKVLSVTVNRTQRDGVDHLTWAAFSPWLLEEAKQASSEPFPSTDPPSSPQ